MDDWRESVHLVLRHDAVCDRNGETINASVTQVDLHDFCRLCLTVGLGGFHCVTPLEAQHRISTEIMAFWQKGYGQEYNPDRKEALACLHLHREFDEVVAMVTRLHGAAPLILGTSAQRQEKTLDFAAVSSILLPLGRPVVLQFGTAWGLSEQQIHRCDWVLPPIDGYNGYNHLSVRCAAAILVDRFVHAMRTEPLGDDTHERH